MQSGASYKKEQLDGRALSAGRAARLHCVCVSEEPLLGWALCHAMELQTRCFCRRKQFWKDRGKVCLGKLVERVGCVLCPLRTPRGSPPGQPTSTPARDPACETLPTAGAAPAGLSLAMVQTSVGSPSAEPHQQTLSLLGRFRHAHRCCSVVGLSLVRGARWTLVPQPQPRSAGRLCRCRCARSLREHRHRPAERHRRPEGTGKEVIALRASLRRNACS